MCVFVSDREACYDNSCVSLQPVQRQNEKSGGTVIKKLMILNRKENQIHGSTYEISSV